MDTGHSLLELRILNSKNSCVRLCVTFCNRYKINLLSNLAKPYKLAFYLC